MNSIKIDGHVTADPTTYAPQSSESTCLTFSIANNDESKPDPNNQGKYISVPTFVEITFWTKNPQYWLQQIVKGAPVTIQGRLKQDTWLDKDTQQTRSKLKIIAQAGYFEGFPVVVHNRAPQQQQQGQQGGGFQSPSNQGGGGYQGEVHNTYGGNGYQGPPPGAQAGPHGF